VKVLAGGASSDGGLDIVLFNGIEGLLEVGVCNVFVGPVRNYLDGWLKGERMCKYL
jgi:hypothetical protein